MRLKKKEKVISMTICLYPNEVKMIKSLAKKSKISISEVLRQILKEKTNVWFK